MNEYSYFTLDTFLSYPSTFEKFYHKKCMVELVGRKDGEIKQNFQIGMWKKTILNALMCGVFRETGSSAETCF